LIFVRRDLTFSLDQKDAARRLKRGLALNAPLQCGYLLKEELAELWEQRNGRNARAFLREWCAKAKASGILVTTFTFWFAHASFKKAISSSRPKISLP
jgi:hypothetical protein